MLTRSSSYSPPAGAGQRFPECDVFGDGAEEQTGMVKSGRHCSVHNLLYWIIAYTITSRKIILSNGALSRLFLHSQNEVGYTLQAFESLVECCRPSIWCRVVCCDIIRTVHLLSLRLFVVGHQNRPKSVRGKSSGAVGRGGRSYVPEMSSNN